MQSFSSKTFKKRDYATSYDVKELISKEESLHVKVHLFVTLNIIFLSFQWCFKYVFRSFDIHFKEEYFFFVIYCFTVSHF